MNDRIREQVSALMDGELARDETRFLLRRMEGGESVAACWSRYHVARSVLRRQAIVPLDAGFAGAVMARLAHEPAHVRRSGQWLRWGAGGAVAASVAVAALLVTRPAVEDAGVSAAAVARAAPSPAAAAPVQPVAVRSGEFRPPMLAPAPIETAPVRYSETTVQPIAIDPQVQPYVIGQDPAGASAAPSGFVPYVLLGMPEVVDEPQVLRQERR